MVIVVEEIIEAATEGDATTIEALLARRPYLANRYDDDGWTPLHLAAYFGHCRVAKALLTHGADVNARSKNSLDNMPLHAAVAGWRKDLAALLLQHGADVNARQEGGWAARHEAADHGHLDLVRLLLEHGAHVNVRNDHCLTARAIAQARGHSEVADLL